MNNSKLVRALKQAMREHELRWAFVENTINDINKELHRHNANFKLNTIYSHQDCDVCLSGKTAGFDMTPRKLFSIQAEPLSIVTCDTRVECRHENLATEIINTMSNLKEWPHYAAMIRVFK